MAINSMKSTRWAWDTKLTTLATNTTLGTATRYDTEVQTMYVPETTRAFERVLLRVSFRDAEPVTAAKDLDGVRIGIKINAVAFSDLDITLGMNTSTTADPWTVEFERDVTSYFTTNDPGTASFSIQAAIAVQQAAASVVNNITFELIATYRYDDAAATHADTALLPIQGQAATSASTATWFEVGRDGTAPAPANQIAQLTGVGGEFEGVTGFVLRKRYLLIFANDCSNTATDVNPQYRIDGVTTYARATLEQVNNFGVKFIDILDITSLNTGTAHSWEYQTDVANTMNRIGAIDVVTYEFTASSSVAHVSVAAPLESPLGEAVSGARGTGLAGDADRLTATIDIQEPGTIVTGRCGVVLSTSGYNATADEIVVGPGQTARTYTATNRAQNSGLLVHRIDHSGSTLALARGRNVVSLNRYLNAAYSLAMPVTGFVLLNYRCGKPAGGASRRNRTVFAAQVIAYDDNKAAITQTPTPPNIPEADYALGPSFVHCKHTTIGYGTYGMTIGAARDDAGWILSRQGNTTSDVHVHALETIAPTSRWFKHRPGAPVGVDVEASRRWFADAAASFNVFSYQASLWLTYHAITFTVGGTVTVNGNAAANGETVEIFAKDIQRTAPAWRATGTAVSGVGAVSPAWPDHTAGSIALLFVESEGSEAAPTLSVPAGFSQIATYVDTTVTDGTRLTVFWCRATSAAMSAPTVADGGDHQLAVILTFDGCVATGNPWDAFAGDSTTAGGASTTATIPGPTTTTDQNLIVAAYSTGTTAGAASAWANANLIAGPYERADVAYGAANTIAVACGVKPTAGAVGNTTATVAASSRQARFAISLKSPEPSGEVEFVTTATIAGGAGAYTAAVPDNTRSYFASYDDGTNRGISALGAPV